jgi:hypothetical protein
MWFGDGKNWHAVHAGKELVPKGFRETTFENLMISLVS